ncbi:hypothetical protein HPULCUR_008790 [Helicostylum pulchrum]|uniref:Uncharacterized protein n=1 Tax=Helicostylum pulchrum TaxID=562976 RepID=A0ABP9Y8L4_9FUNG
MHWKQSVQIIVSNYAVVPPNKSNLFETLTYQLQSTTNRSVFIESGRKILTGFPSAPLWIKWWLQPSITSTIFNCRTLMKDDLRKHESRTSDTIESYHSALYRLIPKRKALGTSFRLLLQVRKKRRASYSSSLSRKIVIGDGFAYMKADEWRVYFVYFSFIVQISYTNS